ncbi:glycosyl transferase [Leptolyngbya sp. Heron Island J]|uniref:glycosyltransferase family 2 protein n=1 Tax=Leptolyngbya sp. Heron Island J TaxID=1385935 RepID=UPI0003B98D72|nr:glycosyltransferase [Leptolyngbya sp. Heron Island J]ESA37697.1 glycosyl transferase [Leptolyngbya sp. Heron Island J]
MKVVSRSTDQILPDVSVVIPTYNRISMLKEAIATVLNQTFAGNTEIIVIDDNSKDGTPKTIQEQYPDIYLIACSENHGPAAARNQGIRAAKGRYIAFLDSDDLWESDYLQTQIDALDQQSATQANCFSVSDVWLWKTEKDIRIHCKQGKHPDFSSFLHHLLAAGSFIHTPSAAVFPRQAFDRQDLFNESLRFAEDTDLYIRLIIDGYQPIFTRKPLVTRRKHGQGQAIEFKNIDRRIQNRINILQQYYPAIKGDQIDISLEEIRAQIYSQFATQCYRSQHFLKWASLLQTSADYTSWQAVWPRIKHDIGFTTRRLSSFLQKWRTIKSV